MMPSLGNTVWRRSENVAQQTRDWLDRRSTPSFRMFQKMHRVPGFFARVLHCRRRQATHDTLHRPPTAPRGDSPSQVSADLWSLVEGVLQRFQEGAAFMLSPTFQLLAHAQYSSENKIWLRDAHANMKIPLADGPRTSRTIARRC